jgi:hypothetical protein
MTECYYLFTERRFISYAYLQRIFSKLYVQFSVLMGILRTAHPYPNLCTCKKYSMNETTLSVQISNILNADHNTTWFCALTYMSKIHSQNASLFTKGKYKNNIRMKNIMIISWHNKFLIWRCCLYVLVNMAHKTYGTIWTIRHIQIQCFISTFNNRWRMR